jgi:Kef-type K+ transport system membrane component KefB
LAETFFINIVIMLVTALALGEVFKRIHQPALVGHLLAGVIIGPSLLNIVQPDESLETVINLSIFFLMFLAGLELHPEQIRKAGKNAIILSVLAFIVPFVGGVVVSDILGLEMITSLFIGLTLAITAVPVSAVVLMEFGLLQSKMGSTIMTAGIVDDILSLITLAIILQLAQNGGEIEFGEIGFSIFKIVAFLGGIFLLIFILKKTHHWLPQKFSPFFEKLKTREAGFGILLVSALGLSLIAEAVGLHFVIGTFFAGLLVYKELVGFENVEKINDVFSAITFGFLSPIFFAFIGMEFYAQSLADHLPLFLILLAVAIAGKIGGGFIGGKLTGFSNSESKIIGYLVNSRGMVELIIATIGFELGIIDQTLFTVIVAVGFITTIMAPIMARIALRRNPSSQKTESENK